MKTVILALAFGASALADAAAAQTQPAPPRTRMDATAMLMQADTNGDGVITRAESIADADGRFAQMDTNHDGLASADEVRAYREAMRDRMIASGGNPPPPRGDRGARPDDQRGNDRPAVSRADYEARAAARFDRMDTNHDGKLDQAEIAAMATRGGRRSSGDGMTPPATPPAQ